MLLLLLLLLATWLKFWGRDGPGRKRGRSERLGLEVRCIERLGGGAGLQLLQLRLLSAAARHLGLELRCSEDFGLELGC